MEYIVGIFIFLILSYIINLKDEIKILNNEVEHWKDIYFKLREEYFKLQNTYEPELKIKKEPNVYLECNVVVKRNEDGSIIIEDYDK